MYCMYICLYIFVVCLYHYERMYRFIMHVCMYACMYVIAGRESYPERYHPRCDNHSTVRQGHFCPRRGCQAHRHIHHKVQIILLLNAAIHTYIVSIAVRYYIHANIHAKIHTHYISYIHTPVLYTYIHTYTYTLTHMHTYITYIHIHT